MTTTTLNPIQVLANQFLDESRADIEKYGRSTRSTYPHNIYGWNADHHYAMEYLQRHCPDDLHISREVRFQVTDWVVTVK